MIYILYTHVRVYALTDCMLDVFLHFWHWRRSPWVTPRKMSVPTQQPTKVDNITAAWVVDREFVNIDILLRVRLSPFVVPFSSFGMPLGSVGVPLRSFGAPVGSSEVPLGSCGVPLGSFGVLGLIWVPRERSSMVNSSKICFFGIRNGSKHEQWEQRKWSQKRWLGPHLPRMPGARMTIVTQTPSIYLCTLIVICKFLLFPHDLNRHAGLCTLAEHHLFHLPL